MYFHILIYSSYGMLFPSRTISVHGTNLSWPVELK